MNVINTNANSRNNNQPVRRERRERDFGTGYGSSSGYAAAPGYTANNSLRMFRFA